MINIFNFIGEYNYEEIVKLFLQQALNDDNWEEREDNDNIFGHYYSLEGEFKIPNSDLTLKYRSEKDDNNEHYGIGILVYKGDYMLDQESLSWGDVHRFYSGAKYYYPLILTRWFHPADVIEGMRQFEINRKEQFRDDVLTIISYKNGWLDDDDKDKNA